MQPSAASSATTAIIGQTAGSPDVTFPETRSSQSRIKWFFPDIF
ncbi:hypothetical protein [Burkholderia ubonensis]|nr:hypothetical protein [Burkholderia ubonensis]